MKQSSIAQSTSIALLCFACFFITVQSAIARNSLDAPENIDARISTITAKLRCLQCQNQSVTDSEAPFAKSIRKIVREHVHLGKTDGEIIDFLVTRYGEFISLRPKLTLTTAILWLGPFGLLLLVCVIWFWQVTHDVRQP